MSITNPSECLPCAVAIEEFGVDGASTYYTAARKVLLGSQMIGLFDCPNETLSTLPHDQRTTVGGQIAEAMHIQRGAL